MVLVSWILFRRVLERGRTKKCTALHTVLVLRATIQQIRITYEILRATYSHRLNHRISAVFRVPMHQITKGNPCPTCYTRPRTSCHVQAQELPENCRVAKPAREESSRPTENPLGARQMLPEPGTWNHHFGNYCSSDKNNLQKPQQCLSNCTNRSCSPITLEDKQFIMNSK
jgi:hypothetical protein